MKIAIKSKDNIYAGYGTKTLTTEYKKRMDDWYEHQDEEYDIVFCIYDDAQNVKAKHKVYLIAEQNEKSYRDYSKNYAKYADDFTDVFVLRKMEAYDEIQSDFPNAKMHIVNFNLFDFDNKVFTNERKDEIVHIGRICHFKNSDDIVLNPQKYINNRPICCFGSNLFEKDNPKVKNEKGCRLLKNDEMFNYDESKHVSDKINVYGYFYDKPENICKDYKYAISCYTNEFDANCEYAMLEMINAGCFIILNESFVNSFNQQSKIGNMPYCIIRKEGQSIDDAIKNEKLIDVNEYVKQWREFYTSKKILESMLKEL